MSRGTERERININVYIDKAVAQRLQDFVQQQAMWKGRVVEAAIVEYLNKMDRYAGIN